MAIMGIPSDRFLEDNVSMDQLSMPDFHELKMRVLDSATDREAISIIETFIKRRLYNHDTDIYLKPLQRVCQEIALHPNINMDRLSDIACMSERQLRRIFSENIGLSPKQMLRTRRFLHATHMIRSLHSPNFTDIVADLGYTDHSHLNKEFRYFAGMTPTQYMHHLLEIKESNFIKGYFAYHTE